MTTGRRWDWSALAVLYYYNNYRDRLPVCLPSFLRCLIAMPHALFYAQALERRIFRWPFTVSLRDFECASVLSVLFSRGPCFLGFPISPLLDTESIVVMRDSGVQSHVTSCYGSPFTFYSSFRSPEFEHCHSRVVCYFVPLILLLITCDPVPSSIKHNVKLNRLTTLTTPWLYTSTI